MVPLKTGYYYHIYNRGAGKSNLFWTDGNYLDFIKKYFYYLHISVETYAYCLLKNHFHFLIRVRTFEEQERIFQNIKEKYGEGTFFGDHFSTSKPFIVSKQFSHLMNSYTKSINASRNRSGTLVESAFKRKKVVDEKNFNHLVCYIHRNPIHHSILKEYSAYPYSSYNEILDSSNTFLERSKLLNQFGGKKNFIEAHVEFKEMLDEEYYFE